jgi:hypothetical protein
MPGWLSRTLVPGDNLEICSLTGGMDNCLLNVAVWKVRSLSLKALHLIFYFPFSNAYEIALSSSFPTSCVQMFKWRQKTWWKVFDLVTQTSPLWCADVYLYSSTASPHPPYPLPRPKLLLMILISFLWKYETTSM